MVPPSWTAAIAAGALPEALVPLVTGAAGFVIGRQSELLLQREDVKLKLKEYEDVLKQSWEEIQQDVVQFARQVEAQTRELVLWNTLRAVSYADHNWQDACTDF